MAMRIILVVSLLHEVHVANGKIECHTCQGPKHSWATLPVSWHSSQRYSDENGGFTAEELKSIAKFPLVTIEKWQGERAPKFLWEEDAMIYAAKQVKAVNPSASIVAWFDSVRIYTGWSFPYSREVNYTLNPDAKTACTTGHFRPAEFLETHPEYLLKNSSGLPAVEAMGCHIYNFGEEIARRYWKDMCLEVTKSGAIDGCGADAAWQNASWGVTDEAAQLWNDGHRQAMRETMEALGDGLLVGKEPTELGDFVSGVLHETCRADNGTIQVLRGLDAKAKALGRRLVYQCHSKSRSPSADEVAAFLIGAAEDQYYATGIWNTADNISSHWLPEFFEPPLGEPESDGIYDAKTGVWTRSFQSGTHVTFDTKTNKGKIRWAQAPPVVMV